jgi:hypothetical protein
VFLLRDEWTDEVIPKLQIIWNAFIFNIIFTRFSSIEEIPALLVSLKHCSQQPKWNQFKCVSNDEWIKKTILSFNKKENLVIFNSICEPEEHYIKWNKPAHKDKCYMISLICRIYKRQNHREIEWWWPGATKQWSLREMLVKEYKITVRN